MLSEDSPIVLHSICYFVTLTIPLFICYFVTLGVKLFHFQFLTKENGNLSCYGGQPSLNFPHSPASPGFLHSPGALASHL